MYTLLADITILSLAICLVITSSFNLPMRQWVHIHHSIGGLLLSITIATLVILFTFFEHGHSRVDNSTTGIARTAFHFRSAVGVLTNKFTFGFRALGLHTLPVTFGFFTNGFTFGFRHLTVSHTVGFFTDSDTFGTVIHFTGFIRAHDLTVGLFTLDITDGILGFLARRVAFRRFTDRSTHSITFGVITLPGTFGVTFQLLQGGTGGGGY